MRWLLPVVALAVAVAAVLSRLPALGLGLRVAFVLASAAPVGSVLLLAIERLVGADWRAAAPAGEALGWCVPLGAVAMLGATGVPLPAHLALYGHPLFAAARAALALGALAWAGARLRAGAGETSAGITLALYAALVTPIGADWLLPTAPGHPVSAVGMMLFLLQFAAGLAAAIPLATGRTRRDFALLLVAAALGLCYLGFVDYLIVWFGNLPEHVRFYLARPGGWAIAGLAVGLGGTALATAWRREGWAALTAMAGAALFAWWWMAAGALAGLIGIAAAGVLALGWRRAAHG